MKLRTAPGRLFRTPELRRPALRPAPITTAALLASLALLGGCGKAGEVAAEKMIEAQAAKEGVQAKVDLKGDSATITTTNAQGQTTQIEAGNAGITEAELGLPIYPGAKMDPASASRVATPEGTMLSVSLHSSDPPAKVAAFYRDLLRARAQGKQFMDTSTGEGALLLLNDEATRSGVQISIGQVDNGTDMQLQVINGKPR